MRTSTYCVDCGFRTAAGSVGCQCTPFGLRRVHRITLLHQAIDRVERSCWTPWKRQHADRLRKQLAELVGPSLFD